MLHCIDIGVRVVGRLGNSQIGVEALIAEVQRAADFDSLGRNAFPEHFAAGLVGQSIEDGLQLRNRRCGIRLVHAPHAVPDHVGHADSISTEDARIGMIEHLPDAQLPGHRTGVLGSRTAKRHQNVLAGVIALGDRNGADGPRHVGVGHAQQPVGQLVRLVMPAGGLSDLLAQFGQTGVDGRTIQGEGKPLGQDLALVEVQIGHGQGTAASVAGRAGIGACALGSHDQLDAVEAADRPAAGGHGLDGHHRRHHAYARLLGLILELVAAVVAGYVGAGSAHVEADCPIEARISGHVRKAHHSARRAREDAVLAHELIGIDQPPGRREDLQPAPPNRLSQTLNVRPQYGVQVGVHHGGVAAGDDLHQGRHPAGKADFVEADLLGDLAHQLFMLRAEIGVQETNGQRLDALALQGGQLGTDRCRVWSNQDFSFGRDPLIDFHYRREQRLGLADRELEQLGPVLVADPEDVAEALRGDEGRSRPPAGDQGVGAPRSAQPDDHGRKLGRKRQSQHVPDAHYGSFFPAGKLVWLSFGRVQRQGDGQTQRGLCPLESRDRALGDRFAA